MDKNLLIRNLSRIVVWSSVAAIAVVNNDNKNFVEASIKFKENALELFDNLGLDKDEMVELFLAEIDTIETE